MITEKDFELFKCWWIPPWLIGHHEGKYFVDSAIDNRNKYTSLFELFEKFDHSGEHFGMHDRSKTLANYYKNQGRRGTSTVFVHELPNGTAEVHMLSKDISRIAKIDSIDPLEIPATIIPYRMKFLFEKCILKIQSENEPSRKTLESKGWVLLNPRWIAPWTVCHSEGTYWVESAVSFRGFWMALMGEKTSSKAEYLSCRKSGGTATALIEESPDGTSAEIRMSESDFSQIQNIPQAEVECRGLISATITPLVIYGKRFRLIA